MFLILVYDDHGLAILVVCMLRVVLRLYIIVMFKPSRLKFGSNFNARNSIFEVNTEQARQALRIRPCCEHYFIFFIHIFFYQLEGSHLCRTIAPFFKSLPSVIIIRWVPFLHFML